MSVTESEIYQSVSLDRRGLSLKAYEAYGKKYPDVYRGYNEPVQSEGIRVGWKYRETSR